MYKCDPSTGETEAGRSHVQGLATSSLKTNQANAASSPPPAPSLVVAPRRTCSRNGSDGALGPHAQSVLLALVGREGTHALVEHVRLMPQLCVLAQMLSDHLHPLHLQPFQLLRRKERPEAAEHIPDSGTSPSRCHTQGPGCGSPAHLTL